MRFGGFSRPFRGLTVCGDRYFAVEEEGTTVAAVVDGLGHGYESSVAAERAVEVIRDNLHLSTDAIVQRCHEALKPTRGAAVGVLKISAAGSGEFCGVGNIEVQSLVGRPPSVFCIAGIVGHNMRLARSMAFQMDAGDIYCVHSDGVSARGEAKKSCLPGPPDEVARRIVETWGRQHDDATALVLGYQADAMLSAAAAASR